MRFAKRNLWILFVFAAAPALAGTINFSGDICSASSTGDGAFTACSNGAFINQAHGDAADVNVTYRDMKAGSDSLRYWDFGYNELADIAWATGGDCASGGNCSFARIEIAPSAGLRLDLIGFDLGAFPQAQRTTDLRILELGTNNVLVDYGTVLIGAGNHSTSFAPAVSSALGIAIEWRDTAFNVGIDNINFRTTAVGPGTVPEPNSFALMASAAAIVFLGRMKRSAGRTRVPSVPHKT